MLEDLRNKTKEAKATLISKTKTKVKLDEETAKTEIQAEADVIIADIEKIAGIQADCGSNSATIMWLSYKGKYHHYHYMHTGLLDQRSYNMNSLVLNGLRPEHLKNAAKLVFDYCKAKGLNPSVSYEDFNGCSTGWFIKITW